MFRRAFRNLALLAALIASLARVAAADSLPRLEADSLGGTHVVFPSDEGGKSLILLLAFTKESEGDLKAWSRKFLEDHIAEHAVVYVVVVADRTASFARHHVRKIVEGAAVGTRDQLENNVLITFNGSGWRSLVPPGDKTTSGIVVCDPAGSIVYAKREPFNEANLAEVERAAE